MHVVLKANGGPVGKHGACNTMGIMASTRKEMFQQGLGSVTMTR